MNKILAVVDTVPNCYHGGGGITAYSAILGLQKKYNVEILILKHFEGEGEKTELQHINHLKELGFTVHHLSLNNFDSPSIFKKLTSTIEGNFPTINLSDKILPFIDKINPDYIWTYHWEASAAVARIDHVKKFFTVGDPIHLPLVFREAFKRRYLKPTLKEKIKSVIINNYSIPQKKKAMIELFKMSDTCGAFAAHHAKEFQDQGIQKCHYLKTPVPLPPSNVEEIKKSDKFKILHIGHLQGIATLSGVEILVNEIVPALKEKIGHNNFEVSLVGGNFEYMPKELQQKISNESHINVKGQVSPPHEEFKTSHVVLVPTPIELGIRVRIITAFSYASAVVTHIANQKGIPELSHNKNCLIGENAEQLISHCYEIFNNEEKRIQLEKNAFQCYQENFSIEKSGEHLASLI